MSIGMVEFNKFNYGTVGQTYNDTSETEIIHRLGQEIQLIEQQTQYIKDNDIKPQSPVGYSRLLDVL